MYKNNNRNGSKYKGCGPLQLSRNLIGKCYAAATYFYTNRCTQALNSKRPRKIINLKNIK